MANRGIDWFSQAERDLERARLDVRYQYYEWACFTSQQAAEKAVKALHLLRNKAVRGHGILKLLKAFLTELDAENPEYLLHAARILDRYYMETRYPNGFPSGKPADYFDLQTAAEAVDAAEKILEYCRNHIH